MSIPQVPPRPARSHHQHPDITSMEIPKVPPRPNRRTSERSVSPDRDNFPRSPFNEPPPSRVPREKSSFYKNSSRNTSEAELPQRPPSVSIPSIGEEGNEYADIIERVQSTSNLQEQTASEAQETRNVAGDLPLHAPKPSFSKDNAKQRVAAVTRTDSGQVAALGLGKVPSRSGSAKGEKEAQDSSLRPKVSFRTETASSADTERPGSAQVEEDEERGIPEIGQRVPMLPDAGDVQAPSTSPFPQQSPAGIGFHNSGQAKPGRHHRRTPSGREVLPPDSYGLHGHGVPSADQFERDWYSKHPEALDREEHGEYGPGIGGGRGGWALSSDDLNKLVRNTSRTTLANSGPTDERFGYQTSEEYSSRINTPHSATFGRIRSASSQAHAESPLRKSSFPVDTDAASPIQEIRSHKSLAGSTEDALDSETEDDDTHDAPSAVRNGKYTSNGNGTSSVDLELRASNVDGTGEFADDGGYDVPILAADEVARTPGAEFMQPAVSPAASRRGSSYYVGAEYENHPLFKPASRSESAANSRPTSRPGSVHKFTMHDDERENMHTPLEDVDEYEPLFPEEDGKKKHVTAAQRLKLREQMKRFPSKDIWEDTPNSLQLHATVDTPEPAVTAIGSVPKAAGVAFETPQQEAARKGEVGEDEKAKLVPKEERLAKSSFKPHLRHEMNRPGMAQRFPSKDIWEDSPDSAELTTTVGNSVNDIKSPTDEGLEAGAVVQTSGNPNEGILAGEQSREMPATGAIAAEKPTIPPRPKKDDGAAPTSASNQQPAIPARPPKRLHQVPPADAKVPIAPSKLSQSTSPTDDRKPAPIESAKPQVPARPAKTSDTTDTTPLSKVTSASSIGSEGSDKGLGASSAPKPKPAVPAKAAGKFGALQGGFLADLNSRLKIGPSAPKIQEKEPQLEEEKAPLEDARKGRAKGPAKRKPAAPVGEAAAQTKQAAPTWSICQPVTIWQTDEDGRIQLAQSMTGSKAAPPVDRGQLSGKPMSPEVPTSDLPTPIVEAERNPLSIEPNTPIVSSPTIGKAQSPEAVETKTEKSIIDEQPTSKPEVPGRLDQEDAIKLSTDDQDNPTAVLESKEQVGNEAIPK
ncbi:uncharacterized protein KY384_000740 [Bacidia gigantensis]|uniref:uncharacterized protein n=1 Tax=Bacidia gigantensis TaxID=2732470 RepID=UPI001D048054|nr:uncharacterized protein KY384_000740 [Bacidia gigantensis]KAG8525978.1 hypothetical protein KY384_000740 [Bacidia gigantensis]